MRVNRLTKLVSVHAKKIQFIAHAMLTINRTVLCCQTYKPTLQYSSRWTVMAAMDGVNHPA